MNAILLSVILWNIGAPAAETSDTPSTRLYVRTVPAGARVTLDGKPLGKSDGLFLVPPGVARLEIVLDGRHSEIRQVEISEGRITRIAVELKPEERRPAPESSGGLGTRRRAMLVYEANSDVAPSGGASGMDLLTKAIDRRLNSGGTRVAYVFRGSSASQTIAVVPIRDHAAEQPRIERLLAAAGRLQFLLLANERDQKAIVDRARHWPPAANMPSCQPFWADVEQTRGHTTPSKAGRLPVKPPREKREKVAVWWAPVGQEAEASLAGRPDAVMRTRKQQQGSVAEVVVLSAPYNVTDEHILGAAPGNCDGRPCVNFMLTKAGGELLGKLTGQHLPGKNGGFATRLAVILDGEVVAAPAIKSQIGYTGVITGRFTAAEADSLARILNTGRLPASVRLVERKQVPAQEAEEMIRELVDPALSPANGFPALPAEEADYLARRLKNGTSPFDDEQQAAAGPTKAKALHEKPLATAASAPGATRAEPKAPAESEVIRLKPGRPAVAPPAKKGPVEMALAGNFPQHFLGTDRDKENGMPLSDFFSFVHDWANINVWIDVRALRDAGISPDVSLRREVWGSDILLASALDILLSQVGLTWTVHDDILRITTPKEASLDLRTETYPLSNLTTSKELSGVIVRTVDPTSWNDPAAGPVSTSTRVGLGSCRFNAAAGQESLVVLQSYAVQRQVAGLLADLEILASRRGGVMARFGLLPPALGQEGYWRQTPQTEAIRKTLDKREPASPNFNDQPLEDIADYLTWKFGVNVLVDRKALKAGGIGDAKISVDLLKDIPLSQMLSVMLKDAKLTYTVVDDVLLITTPAVAEQSFSTAVYPIGDLMARGQRTEDLVATIRKTIAPARWDSSRGGGAIVGLSGAVDALVIRQTTDVHRKIADLLGQLRRQPRGKP